MDHELRSEIVQGLLGAGRQFITPYVELQILTVEDMIEIYTLFMYSVLVPEAKSMEDTCHITGAILACFESLHAHHHAKVQETQDQGQWN